MVKVDNPLKHYTDDGLVKQHSQKLISEAANTEMMRRLKNKIVTLDKSIKRFDANTTKYSNAMIFLMIAFGLVAVFQIIIMVFK